MEEIVCVKPKKSMGSQPSKSKKEKQSSPPPHPPSHASGGSVGGREEHEEDHSPHKHHHPNMPLLRKQSSPAKKRLQHQLYLAKESPEPTFDVSGCELSDIPAGVFSLCKVLHKQTLLVHNNWLTSLKGGGNLHDLAALRILDLHKNELPSLPDDIHVLSSLQILNVADNKLKSLPQSLTQLTALQTLNLKGNKLKTVPECIYSLPSLRTLDLSGNQHLTKLSTDLASVRTLENLILDASNMTYPSPDVCSRGTESVMRFLCEESGRNYVPPSSTLLPVLDPPALTATKTSQQHQQPGDSLSFHISDMVAVYEQQKDQKRRERMLLEQQLEEEQKQQAALVSEAARNKQHLMRYLSKEGQRLAGEVTALQQQREREHGSLLRTMSEAEQSATRLVEQVVLANKASRKTEELLERLEAERQAMEEQWWQVRDEELQALRRADVLRDMERNLVQNQQFMEVTDQRRKQNAQNHIRSEHETDGHYNAFLSNQRNQHSRFVDHLVKEEEMQKDAFERLQQEKDARHTRLTSQISIIEQELIQLSRLELEEKQLKVNQHMGMLEEKRMALTKLLMQLMGEREKREQELKKRLLELEEHRENTNTEYWLVQYQRLMDRKPTALIDEEKKLEISVVSILEAACAGDYIPVFARHRISIESMTQLTDADLAQMGVHELGLRKAILKQIQVYLQEEETAAAKSKKLENPDDYLVRGPEPEKLPDRSVPSAPARTPTNGAPSFPMPPAEPSADSPITPSHLTAHYNAECVICMERQSCVLMLNCGHVCCCGTCADTIQECPLCRATIISRINVTGALNTSHLPH